MAAFSPFRSSCIINIDMRHLLPIVILLAVAISAVAGIVGVFQGRIVHPSGAKREDGVLYVQARNGMARKVKVEKAVVVEYDEDVPKIQRKKEAAQSLCDDTLIRVTAEQSEKEDGEWKAINILILPDPDRKSGQARVRKTSFDQSGGTKEKLSGTNGFCAPKSCFCNQKG